MMWLLASAAALAGGYRQHAVSDGDQFTARLALAPGSVTVFQQTPRLRLRADRVALDLSLPVVQAVGPEGWRELGLGRARAEGRLMLGLQKRTALGVAAAGVLAPESLWVTTWGSHSRETLPGAELSAFVEVDLPIGLPWTIAVSGGLNDERYTTSYTPLLIAVRSFQSWPLSEQLSAVSEQEFIALDSTPLALRGLLRWQTPTGWRLDVGLQQPLISQTRAPLYPQVIGQVQTAL